MPMPVTATALILRGSSIAAIASFSAAALPPQICSGCQTVHSGCAGSGWKRSVGRQPLAMTLPRVS